MDDLRIWALILAVVGVLLGLIASVVMLGIISVVLLCILVLAAVEANKAPSGTSGGLGLMLMIVGGELCLALPMWITWLLRK